MKRKLFWAAWAVWALLSAYSAAGWHMLRGAGAYRTGTRLGSLFAASWQITALAALALLAVLVLTLLRMRAWKKRQALSPETEDGEKIAPAGPTELLPEDGEKIAPAGPTELLPEDGEKIAPAGPTEILPEDGEKIAPAGPTEILPEGKTVFSEEMLCPQCGKRCKPGQKFCTDCGTRLEGWTE